MTLFNISLKNLKKSIRDYTIYFFTLVVAVAIFYVFNALESQTVFMNVSSRTHILIDFMMRMLSGVSVFVSIVLGLLIIFASRFLIKRRNKEFGIYMLLGMSKYKISMILFFETLVIGIFSLFGGLFLGVVLSQMMSLFVANMFEADMRQFSFVFSCSSAVKTLIYFGIMYLIVMVFNTFIIGKCKLINLLNSMHQSENMHLKNKYLCMALFILSILILGKAYHIVIVEVNRIDEISILVAIVLGCVGTLFFFYSLSGLLISIISRFKRFYYHRLNSFVIRQFSSEINTRVVSFSVISILLFVTICLLSTCLTIKNSMNANINSLAPVDFQFTTINTDVTFEDGYMVNGKTVKEYFEEIDFNLDEYSNEYVHINTYKTEELTMGDFLGDYLEGIKKELLFLSYDSNEEIIKLSDYNSLAKLYGREEYTLNEDEYIVIADFQSMIDIRNLILKNNGTISVFGKTFKPKYAECQDGIIDISSNHINAGVIILSDDVIDENAIFSDSIIGNYLSDDKDVHNEIETHLRDISSSNPYDNVIFSMNTLLDIKEATVGLTAMIAFIGLYLGVIFLISSALIIALLQLSNIGDNRQRYGILRRLGTDEKEINRTLLKEVGLFFMAPLALAIVHSVPGLIFSIYMIQALGIEKLVISVIVTSIIIIMIYGGYFIITYYSSKRIIKENY